MIHLEKKKKIILVVAGALLVLCLIAYLLFLISKSRTFQFFGELIGRVDTDAKVVALTFDDAPTAQTETVLDILKQKNVKTTFYAIGKNLETFPELAKKIVEEGHELGNHSYSHQKFYLKSQSFIESEIEETNRLIRENGYSGEITFRPPGGKKLFGLPWYLAQHNIKTIMWDVEPDTYFPGNMESIVKYTLENVKPGSIILLHPLCNDECPADREALPIIIDSLKEKGYEFVTISQILKYEKK